MSWEAGESWEQAGVRGASWSELEQAGRLEKAWSKLGASWSELGGWEQTGSKLAPTLPIASCPPEAPGTQGCSGSKGSKLGARGASWGLPDANGGGSSKT